MGENMVEYPDVRDRVVIVKQMARFVEIKFWELIAKGGMDEKTWEEVSSEERLNLARNFILQTAGNYNITLTEEEFNYIINKLVL